MRHCSGQTSVRKEVVLAGIVAEDARSRWWPRMGQPGERPAGDGAVGGDVEVGAFVRGGLEDDEAEAQLKDDLDADKRVDDGVEALLDGVRYLMNVSRCT